MRKRRRLNPPDADQAEPRGFLGNSQEGTINTKGLLYYKNVYDFISHNGAHYVGHIIPTGVGEVRI